MKYLIIFLLCFSLNAHASKEMRNKTGIVLTLVSCPTMSDSFVAYDSNTKMIGCWKGTTPYIIILWNNNTLVSYEYADWRLYETK